MSGIKEISTQTAKDWADAGDAVLLDVREAPGVDAARIAGRRAQSHVIV